MSKLSSNPQPIVNRIDILEIKARCTGKLAIDNKNAITYMNQRMTNFDKIVYIDKYDLEQFSHISTVKFGQFCIMVDKRFNWFQKLFYKIFLGIEIGDT